MLVRFNIIYEIICECFIWSHPHLKIEKLWNQKYHMCKQRLCCTNNLKSWIHFEFSSSLWSSRPLQDHLKMRENSKKSRATSPLIICNTLFANYRAMCQIHTWGSSGVLFTHVLHASIISLASWGRMRTATRTLLLSSDILLLLLLNSRFFI